MAHYRIYLLTHDNHIDNFQIAECVSDVEAAIEAKKLLREHPAAEIWCGTRLVGRCSL
jgi:exonuclease I